ncbi:MAG: nitrate reductase associated protein [Steroidobacteraceae bacterium]
MGNEAAVFDFERDFAGSLHCIPMSVRLKLDCCGVKLSLKQWNRLAVDERERLLGLPCDDAHSSASYRQLLISMVETRTGQAPKSLAIESDPEWAADERIPEQLRAYMATLQLAPLTTTQWAQLGRVQRFALLKLSRPGHDNDNFVPALREFGVLKD